MHAFGARLEVGVLVDDAGGGGAQFAVPCADVAGGTDVWGRAAHQRMRVAAHAERVVRCRC